jgi:hypothetical protein
VAVSRIAPIPTRVGVAASVCCQWTTAPLLAVKPPLIVYRPIPDTWRAAAAVTRSWSAASV